MLRSALRTRLQRRWLAQAAAAPAAALGPTQHLEQLIAAAPAVGLFVVVGGGLFALGTYLVDTRVNKEVSAVTAQSAALNARLDALTKEVDTKTAGLAKEVDAKFSGLAKELDAKNAGLASSITKEVDAKYAGLAREVDAKVAGVIAGAAMKAEAETLRVFKEYKISVAGGEASKG